MGLAETNDVATRQLAAVNQHDPDAVAALFAPDAKIDTPSTPDGIGPEAIRADYTRLFRAFPDLTVTELDRLHSDDGNRVAILWTATATHTGPLEPPGFAPSLVRGGSRGMTHTEVRDGKVVSFRLYYDLTDLGRQIGAVPPEGTFAERIGVRMQRMKASGMRRKNRR
jgi:steroid delta-isomerase-like uncharacterized protein